MANAIIIGQDSVGLGFYSTWAQLRTVFSEASVNENWNIEYPIMVPTNSGVSLKSAASGSGWIKGDRVLFGNVTNDYLNFRVQGSGPPRPNPFPPPPNIQDFELILSWWDYTTNSTLIPLEVQNQLIGQAVTFTVAAPFNLNIDIFTTNQGRYDFLIGSSVSPGIVTGVGKLTPIT